jgi:hypothetical protein
MISFFLDAVLYTGVWVFKKTYDGITYVVYGYQESTDEKLQKLMDENIKYQSEIKTLLEEIKNNTN